LGVGSASFTGAHRNSAAEFIADPEPHLIAEPIDKGQNRAEEATSFGLHEQAKQSRRPQAESQRRGASRRLVDQHVVNPALHGEGECCDLTRVEIPIRGQHRRQAKRCLDGDEAGKRKAVKTGIGAFESLEFRL